ncbi:MAG TPA: AMP-binding protein [Propionicimonas sp.]|nr:AMP-binding protein [Propionicimonas sp.]
MHASPLAGPDLVAGIRTALVGGPAVAPRCEPRLAAALRLDVPVTEADAALIVPTSGTTGDPKAVVLSATAIRFAASAAHDRLGGPGDWVCALPTEHVAGLMTIARAVVADTDVRFARRDLSDLPQAGPRSYVSVVAAQLHRALGEPAVRDTLAGYAAVLVGGSAIDADLLAAACRAGIAVVTTYGASETCGGCVYDGRPLDGVRIELDDERINLGGPMVFSGYRLRPELTAEVLHGDLVRTQDRGRLHDGRLQVLGRVDDVVISGGEKVDLAAVQRLCDDRFGPSSDGGPVLLAVPDARFGSRIVAVATKPWDLAQLQRDLEPLVGRAGVPKELRQLSRLAYTSLGKIDRAALQRAWEQKEEHGDVG